MKTEQIIKTLQEYNDWRRSRGKWDEWDVDFALSESFFDSVTAHEIGLTIDAAIERLQILEKERDEARGEAEMIRALYRDAYQIWGFPLGEGEPPQ